MSNVEHLDDQAMVSALDELPHACGYVRVANCRLCDQPLVIARVAWGMRAGMPHTPQRSAFRAFDRELVSDGRTWRSSKRHGFVVNTRDVPGFRPHDCPRADWRQA